jgi:dTDP-4-dehydrorhamnose 3,5-epimerase
MTAPISTARAVREEAVPLPQGVLLRALATHDDSRGNLTEIFREQWDMGARPLQWNLVRSEANVLRGVHAHRDHIDFLTMAAGEMILGLHDLRRNSPTRGLSTLLRLQADDQHIAVVPVGVAHGFYFAEAASVFYGLTHYFDGKDDIGCLWNEPELGLDWPCTDPILSQRDRSAGSYAALVAAFES